MGDWAVDNEAGAPVPSAATADDRERQLLRLVASGDQQAFQVLYVGYHRRLARFLTRLTRRFDVAEEIINDTFWVVWRKADGFRGDSQVSTWIMGIAYRRALKALKHLQAISPPPGWPADEPSVATDESQNADELHEMLDQALLHLPPEQRLVLELTYYLGHSCTEIAAIMDCPVNTVKTRMFHARRKLRALLPHLEASDRGGQS